WKRMITMHTKTDGKSTVFDMKPGCVFEATPVTHPLGGAGLISSLDDYSAFAEMLLDNGVGVNGRVLDELAVRMISTPHVPKSIMRGAVQWGLGMRVITGADYPSLDVGTYGWSGAYGTHFWIDPANRVTAVYLKNAKYDGGSGSRTGRMFECDVYDSMK
nr:beta-lactamase family protein [Clostridia bacterium]